MAAEITVNITQGQIVVAELNRGISGTSGFSGRSGFSGANPGTSGVSGTSGKSGFSGRSGFSGTSGVGTSGTSGRSGYSGVSGTTGLSGTTGVSGTSGSSGVSGAASDIRLKKNIQPYTEGLNVIQQMNPVTFNWNGLWIYAPEDRETSVVGIIGQELEPILPQAIKRSRGKLQPESEETEIIEINLQAIVYTLLNATKELAARIEVLEKSNGH